MHFKIKHISAALALLLAVSGQQAWAENTSDFNDDKSYWSEGDTIYVSDSANVWIRMAPGRGNRITGSRHPGDALTFIKFNQDGSFAQVEDVGGKFWMATSDLQKDPCGKAAIAPLEARLKALDEILGESGEGADPQAVKNKILKLEAENKKLKAIIQEQNDTIGKLDSVRRENSDDNDRKEMSLQMRWWVQGAMIAFCGAVIGIIFVYIPRPGRRKRRDLF